jgi:hypothetical protein
MEVFREELLSLLYVNIPVLNDGTSHITSEELVEQTHISFLVVLEHSVIPAPNVIG